jgi:hypothetical protein
MIGLADSGLLMLVQDLTLWKVETGLILGESSEVEKGGDGGWVLLLLR